MGIGIRSDAEEWAKVANEFETEAFELGSERKRQLTLLGIVNNENKKTQYHIYILKIINIISSICSMYYIYYIVSNNMKYHEQLESSLII